MESLGGNGVPKTHTDRYVSRPAPVLPLGQRNTGAGPRGNNNRAGRCDFDRSHGTGSVLC